MAFIAWNHSRLFLFSVSDNQHFNCDIFIFSLSLCLFNCSLLTHVLYRLRNKKCIYVRVCIYWFVFKWEYDVNSLDKHASIYEWRISNRLRVCVEGIHFSNNKKTPVQNCRIWCDVMWCDAIWYDGRRVHRKYVIIEWIHAFIMICSYSRPFTTAYSSFSFSISLFCFHFLHTAVRVCYFCCFLSFLRWPLDLMDRWAHNYTYIFD